MIYPEPEKGGRGKKADANFSGSERISSGRLSMARAVLRNSREAALQNLTPQSLVPHEVVRQPKPRAASPDSFAAVLEACHGRGSRRDCLSQLVGVTVRPGARPHVTITPGRFYQQANLR